MGKFKKAINKFVNLFFYYLGFYYILRFINRKKIRVLMYHGVDARQTDFILDNPSLVISTKNFEEQIKYLSKSYNIISIHDLAAHIKKKTPFLPNSVVITFDDGLKNNFINAFPILQKYKVKTTVFLTTGYIDTLKISWSNKFGIKINKEEIKDLYLSWKEIKKMADAGISFGSHTSTHPVLSVLDYEKAEKEIVDSKKNIEVKLNKKINLFAYPYGNEGSFDLNIKKILINYNFLCAVSTIEGLNSLNSDLYELKRISMVDEPLYYFKLRIEGFEGLIEKITHRVYRYFRRIRDEI